MATKWKYSNNSFSPIGYHRLGQSFPRTQLRQRYPDKKAQISIFEVESQPILLSVDFPFNIEYLCLLDSIYGSNYETLLSSYDNKNLNIEYLQQIGLLQNVNLEHIASETLFSVLANLNLESLLSLLYGSTTVCQDPATFIDDIVAYWVMNQESGDEPDLVGDNDLTETSGTLESATGKIGNARTFSASDSECLEIAANSDVQVGDIDFTIVTWVKASTLTAGGNNDIISVFPVNTGAGLTDSSFIIGYRQPAPIGNFRFTVCSGTTVTNLVADNHGSAATDTWYLIIAWHDSVNDTINIQVNNNTPDSASYSSGVNTSTSPFKIGARGSGHTDGWIGEIDDTMLIKGILTEEERTWLWNEGNGRTPDEILGGGCSDTGIKIENLLALNQISYINNEYLRLLDSTQNVNLEHITGEVLLSLTRLLNLEYLQNLSSNHSQTIEALLNTTVGKILLTENLTNLITSLSTSNEYLLRLQLDGAIRLQSELRLVGNNSVNIEYLLRLNSNGQVTIEYVGDNNSVVLIAGLNLEYLIKLANTYQLNCDNSLLINTTKSQLIEYLLKLTVITDTRLEALSILNSNSTINNEYLLSLLSSNRINLESQLNLSTGRVLNVEYVLSLTESRNISVDYTLNANTDGNFVIPLETLVNLSGQQTSNVEVLISVLNNFVTFNELLRQIGKTQSIPLEYYGEGAAISILGDLPLEFITNLNEFHTLNGESIQNLLAGPFRAEYETLAQLINQNTLFNEFTLSLAPNANLKLENNLQFTSEGRTLNIENLRNLIGTRDVPIESLVGVIRNSFVNTEFLSGLLTNNSLNTEHLRNLFGTGSLAIESNLSLATNQDARLEFLLNLSRSDALHIQYGGDGIAFGAEFTIPLEFILNVYQERNVNVEQSRLLSGGQTTNLEGLLGLTTEFAVLNEILRELNSSGQTAIEYAGDGNAFSAIFSLPLEFKTQLQASGATNVEELIELGFSTSALYEILLSLSQNGILTNEYKATLSTSQSLPTEYKLEFTTGGIVLNNEYFGSLGISAGSLLEYLLSVNAPNTINSEFYGGIAFDGVINLESLQLLGVSQASVVEYLRSVGLDTTLITEIVQGNDFSGNYVVNLEYFRLGPDVQGPILTWIKNHCDRIWVRCAGETTWRLITRPTEWELENSQKNWSLKISPKDWSS